MTNILQRSYLNIIGEHFLEWANLYFTDKENVKMYRKFVTIDFMNYAKEKKWHWLIGITSKDWSKRMKFWCIVNNYEFNSKIDRMPELDEITRQPIIKDNKKVTGSFEMVWVTTKNKEEAKEETLEIDLPETDDEF